MRKSFSLSGRFKAIVDIAEFFGMPIKQHNIALIASGMYALSNVVTGGVVGYWVNKISSADSGSWYAVPSFTVVVVVLFLHLGVGTFIYQKESRLSDELRTLRDRASIEQQIKVKEALASGLVSMACVATSIEEFRAIAELGKEL